MKSILLAIFSLTTLTINASTPPLTTSSNEDTLYLEYIATIDAITQRVARGETAGLKYDTIGDWKGVEQLAKIDTQYAAVIRRGDSGVSLDQVELP